MRFTLAAPARVTLALLDVNGRRVRALLDGAAFGAGEHELPIARGGLRPGVYFLALEAAGERRTRRVVVRY